MRRFLKSRIFYGAFVFISTFVLLEVATRAYFSLQVGPRVWKYGTSSYRNEFGDGRRDAIRSVYNVEDEIWADEVSTNKTVYTKDKAMGGYVKFFPNEKKFHKDVDTGEAFPVTINSHGFRGKEFTVEKPDDVIRVLALGASSTVGLWNRDHTTYPYLLEQLLNEQCAGPKRFEVINFAITDAIADQIRAMFVAEGLRLDPDLVTFYEGRNDSYLVHPMAFYGGEDGTNGEGIKKLWYELTRRSLTARFLHEAVTLQARMSAEQTLEILENASETRSREFLTDLEQIRQLMERRGIPFIVISQQANSKSWYGMPKAERMKLKGLTYQQEVEQIQSLIAAGESISGYEFNFLVHDRLMRDLETWANEHDLPFVDFIDILDERRDLMVSWVHLGPEANEIMASTLAEMMLPRTCSQPALPAD